MPRNYATTDPDIISGWWNPGGQLFPTVLLRSGPAFDLLSVDRTIATAALTNPRFRNNAGPIVFRPDQGRAYFMVTPALKRPEKFAGKRDDIVLMDSGSWVPVPPARLQPGVNVSWWVAPEAVNWTVADFDIVADVLETTAADRTPLVAADQPGRAGVRVESALAGTVDFGPLWVQTDMATAAACLFVAAGALGLILWWQNWQDRYRTPRDIKRRAEEMKDRNTPENRRSNRVSVQQIQERVRRDGSHEAQKAVVRPTVPRRKRNAHVADDYPTTRIQRHGDTDQTEPVLRLERPYLGTWPLPEGKPSRSWKGDQA